MTLALIKETPTTTKRIALRAAIANREARRAELAEIEQSGARAAALVRSAEDELSRCETELSRLTAEQAARLKAAIEGGATPTLQALPELSAARVARDDAKHRVETAQGAHASFRGDEEHARHVLAAAEQVVKATAFDVMIEDALGIIAELNRVNAARAVLKKSLAALGGMFLFPAQTRERAAFTAISADFNAALNETDSETTKFFSDMQNSARQIFGGQAGREVAAVSSPVAAAPIMAANWNNYWMRLTIDPDATLTDAPATRQAA
jgi:hypothetical protein